MNIFIYFLLQTICHKLYISSKIVSLVEVFKKYKQKCCVGLIFGPCDRWLQRESTVCRTSNETCYSDKKHDSVISRRTASSSDCWANRISSSSSSSSSEASVRCRAEWRRPLHWRWYCSVSHRRRRARLAGPGRSDQQVSWCSLWPGLRLCRFHAACWPRRQLLHQVLLRRRPTNARTDHFRSRGPGRWRQRHLDAVVDITGWLWRHCYVIVRVARREREWSERHRVYC